MKLLLISLGGCSSLSVSSILKKQKQEISNFQVEVKGTREGDYPKPFKFIEMRFLVEGKNLDKAKVKNAFQLGINKYCGVHASLNAKISFEVEIKEEPLDFSKKSMVKIDILVEGGVSFIFILAIIASILLPIYVNESGNLSKIVKEYSIKSSGSAFPAAIYKNLFEGYEKLYSNVQYFNSYDINENFTEVQLELLNGDIIFASRESKLTNTVTPNDLNSETSANLGELTFPAFGTAIAIVYNLPFLKDVTLNLTSDVLGEIFSGNILFWNDKKITDLNKNANLTSESLIPVVSPKHKCNQAFFKYLSTHSKNFSSTLSDDWPNDFLNVQDELRVMLAVETLSNAIGFVTTNTLTALATSNHEFMVAAIQRTALEDPTLPSLENIKKAMEVHFTSENSSNIRIIDSVNKGSYPISFLQFAFTRNHYLFNNPKLLNQDEIKNQCEIVLEMVKFWNFTLQSKEASVILNSYGMVQIESSLRNNSLEAISLITCNRINLYKGLQKSIEQASYYIKNPLMLTWKKSTDFWSNLTIVFQEAILGGFLYVLMYGLLFFSTTACFLYHLKIYNDSLKEKKNKAVAKNFAQRLQKEQKEKSEDITEEEKFEEILAKKGPKSLKLLGTSDQKTKQARLSTQNLFAVISSLLTCLQLMHLSLSGSQLDLEYYPVYQFVSYGSLLFDKNIVYFWALTIGVFTWLFGMIFIISVRPYLQEFYPILMEKYEFLNKWLALFLPNYAAIFFTPTIEVLAKAFECRYTPNHVFISSFDPRAVDITCYSGVHWVMIIASLLFMNCFTIAVIRFSTILKAFRQIFDLKDEPWLIIYEPYIKCILVIAYYNVPHVAYFISSIILMSLTVALLYQFKPNAHRWFDVLRATLYGFNCVICVILLIIEVAVPENNFQVKSLIREIFSTVVLAITCAGVLFILYFVNKKFKPIISAEDAKKRRNEIDKLFKAISDGDAMGHWDSIEMLNNNGGSRKASNLLETPGLSNRRNRESFKSSFSEASPEAPGNDNFKPRSSRSYDANKPPRDILKNSVDVSEQDEEDSTPGQGDLEEAKRNEVSKFVDSSSLERKQSIVPPSFGPSINFISPSPSRKSSLAGGTTSSNGRRRSIMQSVISYGLGEPESLISSNLLTPNAKENRRRSYADNTNKPALFNPSLSGNKLIPNTVGNGRRTSYAPSDANTSNSQLTTGNNNLKNNYSVSKVSVAPSLSNFPWNDFRDLVVKAKLSGIISTDLSLSLLEEIENEDLFIVLLFKRSEGNFQKFIYLMNKKVSDIIGTKRYGNAAMRSSNSMLASSSNKGILMEEDED
ncbi:hypothetical protein HK099_001098 [Clydaea vesicula]|uniref:PBP domain-containing protein n=1 Tax=Clydaea vesicula TaxID=447962 RepID=A0AAD5Y1D4_9FUNG|nr:hypothetical protein HK099_001098 [Clydaea vesicula]